MPRRRLYPGQKKNDPATTVSEVKENGKINVFSITEVLDKENNKHLIFQNTDH
jgi:hypothetical protein